MNTNPPMPRDVSELKADALIAEMSSSRAPAVPDFPMPGDMWTDGGTIIASVWGNDDASFGPLNATILVLRPSAPYYVTQNIEAGEIGWRVTWAIARDNIVPAVRDYEDQGGDY